MFLTLPSLSCSRRLTTFAFVGASTQSKRRSTVIGSMTRSYCGGRYGPRSRSATDQMKLASCWKLEGATGYSLIVTNRRALVKNAIGIPRDWKPVKAAEVYVRQGIEVSKIPKK